MARQVRRVASFQLRTKIYEKLKLVLTKRLDGTSEFLPGWNDQRVVQEVGGDATLSQVKLLRRNEFGPSYIREEPKQKPINLIGDHPDIAELRADIEKLQRESRAIRRWIKDNFDVVLSATDPLPLKLVGKE